MISAVCFIINLVYYSVYKTAVLIYKKRIMHAIVTSNNEYIITLNYNLFERRE